MNKSEWIRLTLLLCSAAVLGAACTEEIDLQLKSSAPQLVIEANIKSEADTQWVLLSKSQAYNQSGAFTTVSAAQLVFSDDAGRTDTLVELAPGKYASLHMNGIPGRTYSLQGVIENQWYSAVCAMPVPVNIDTILVLEAGAGFGGSGETRNIMYCVFRDPANVANQYLLKARKNGVWMPEFIALTDRLKDGKVFEQRMRRFSINPGDTMEVFLYSIDEAMYKYYEQLAQNTFGNPISGSAAPANPPSNILPLSLGYFNAASSASKRLIIP